MKVLRIENEKAEIIGLNSRYVSVADATAEDLLYAMNSVMDSEDGAEQMFDEYDESKLHNVALQNIYQSLLRHMKTLESEREAIKIGIEDKFIEVEEKYLGSAESAEQVG